MLTNHKICSHGHVLQSGMGPLTSNKLQPTFFKLYFLKVGLVGKRKMRPPLHEPFHLHSPPPRSKMSITWRHENVIGIHPLGTMNVCAKLNGDPDNSCRDISHQAMLVQISSSGDHKCLYQYYTTHTIFFTVKMVSVLHQSIIETSRNKDVNKQWRPKRCV